MSQQEEQHQQPTTTTTFKLIDRDARGENQTEVHTIVTWKNRNDTPNKDTQRSATTNTVFKAVSSAASMGIKFGDKVSKSITQKATVSKTAYTRG